MVYQSLHYGHGNKVSTGGCMTSCFPVLFAQNLKPI